MPLLLLFGVLFCRLVRLGSFPACWRQANVTSIPKGPPTSSVANYRPIFTTSVYCLRCLSAWCLFVLDDLWNAVVYFEFAYRKSLGTCDALLVHFSYTKSASESMKEARIVQIDLSAEYLIGSTIMGILYPRCSVGIGCSVLSIYWQSFCQTDHITLWWMVVFANWLTLCRECRRAVFWARYCFSCKLRSFFPFWKINWSVMLITTLMAVVPSSGVSYSSRVPDPWPWQG